MDGPPHKKPRSSSPTHVNCDNDISWVSELNSELPDELSKLETCATTATAANVTTANNNNNDPLTTSSSRSKAEETIQKNKNLSQLLSSNEPRSQQLPHGVMPMGMNLMNRGPTGYRQTGMMVPPGGSSMQLMAGRQRAAGFGGQGNPGMHGMVPGVGYMSVGQQQQISAGMYQMHNNGGNQIMMNSAYPNSTVTIRHPEFMRHKSVPGPNMAASMSGGHFVTNDTHRTMNGGMFSRSTSVETPYNNGPFSEGPNLMMSGGSINSMGPLPVNQGPNGFGPSQVLGTNSQIPGNNMNSNSIVNGNTIPPQVDTRQNASSATSSAISGNTPSLGLLSPDPSTPRSTTANFQQARTGMLSPETGMFPVSPAIPPEGADQTPNNSSPDEKKRDIQNKLKLLLHAHKCQQQPNNGCAQPRCINMRGLLKHMKECQDVTSCQVLDCYPMRQIIQHWKDCSKKSECTVCGPLCRPNVRRDGALQSQQQQTEQQFSQQHPQQVMQPQQSSHSTTTTSSSQVGLSEGSLQQLQQTQPPNSTYNVLVPSAASSSPSNQTPTGLCSGQGKMAPVATNVPSTTCSSAPPMVTSQNSLDSQYSSLTPSHCNNISSPLSVPPLSQQQQQQSQQGLSSLSTPSLVAPIPEMPGMPRPGKEWQLEIQQNLRNHLVQKLVNAIFPMRETNVVDPERMQSLISYAKKLEGDMFDSASSKEEYYHLLAEKIYKIQKELEEKRQRRAMDVNGPNQIHGAHMHMNQGDPQAYDGPGGFGNPQLNSIYLMNHSVGMGQGQQPQPRMGGPQPSHQQPGHPSQLMDPFGGDSIMHHHHQHPRAHPHHPRMHHQQFMNNPRMGGVDPYPAMSGPRMGQQQSANLVPYRCTDPTVGQMMYRSSAMSAGNMPGGPGMGMMDVGFVNHRAMSSNVRPQFGNDAFVSKHDMMDLQRQHQMQQLDHHHHHHQQGMPSCPPSNSAQHLGASTSMVMGPSHQGASSSSSSSSMAAMHHPAPPISFTPSPADPGGSSSLQPNAHLGSSIDGPQLSPFTRSLMPGTPGVPPSPNPTGFLTPGPLSMAPCSTNAGQNSASSLLSPPSFTNSPAQMGRQQQQSMHFNNNSNATNNGPLSNKSPQFESMSVSTPSGAVHHHHHLSSGSCLTPVHTPAPKVLGTPNPLMRHEDVTDDEVTLIKPELSSIEEFKYDNKAAVHEDITDDEADNHNGSNVTNSMLLHQHGSKMGMDSNHCNLMQKQECQGMHIKTEIKEENNPPNMMMMVDYGAGGSVTMKPVIKIEPISEGAADGSRRDDQSSKVRDSDGVVKSEKCIEKMEAEESKVPVGSTSISNKSEDTASKTPVVSVAGEVGNADTFGKHLTENQIMVPGGSKKKAFSQEELYHALWPVLQKLYQIPECEPFRHPVDAEKLGIPDYHNVIKKPMDMSTVQHQLEAGLYKDPWQFIEDVGLMFDNAWLYNRKTSKVYKYCSKLAEIFDNEIDDIMPSMGYCCGRRHVFSPQVLCCFGKQLCSIPRDTVYYNYQDRYLYCEKCFNELNEEVEIMDDPSQPGLKIKKKLFKKEKNDKLDHEQFVHCKDCDRKMHKICVLYMESVWPEGFHCDNCLKSNQSKRKENRYNAKRLPVTRLGTYLETRVNSLLKKKNSGAGEVTIRVLSSSDKMVDVKPLMKTRFVSRGDMPEGFPYRVKAMFAFEEIDGIDVCFFGMHVQEYGSGCPFPNTRRVYIAYLDSVHFFQPRHLRTTVYHEILIGYLEYAKSQGYEMAHIWACPPSEGDDYIFHCHPPDQKIPKPKRLQDWYKKMLDKALLDRVISDYKDIHKDAIEGSINKVTDMPYFEGDFWPNILEECIKDCEENEKKKRAEEEAAQDTDDFEGECNDRTELEVFAGKKKGQKSGNTKKKNSKSKKPSNRKKTGLSHCGTDLSSKLISAMDKHKEGFFVIRLQPLTDCPNEIRDPDPLINCDLMDGRDAFLTLARDKHYEFSSLRRAKYSSMGLLYELHVQARDEFIYTCNDCKAKVETRYHCGICDDYDLCVACYIKSDHPHKDRMTKLGLELDTCSNANPPGDGKPDQSGQRNSAMVETRSSQLSYYIQSLEHACSCRDANCRMNSCQRMKGFVEHLRNGCRNSKINKTCKICLQLRRLCLAHAKQCERNKCPVPFCSTLKQKMEHQRAETKFKNNQLMRRRMAIMQRGPMLEREEQNSQTNQLPNSDPPTPTSHHPGGYGGGGKYLHHLGSPPPNQGGPHHHQAAMMAAHQAEQMAQSQRQMSSGYAGGPMMMGAGNNQMMMGGGVIAGGNAGNPMMGGGMNPMLAGGSMMPGGGSGPMVGSPAAMMSGGGQMTIQQQQRIMMMQQQQQQHGAGNAHMMDRGPQGGMPFMQDEIYRQHQIMAMQHQGGMDPMLGQPGQGPASNQMAMLLAKKKEAGIMKGNQQVISLMKQQNRQRQITPQMISAGGQMMDGGGMMDEPGMMMNPMGSGGQMMISEQMMGGHGAGPRMLTPQQQQQQQWMMHHHQQQQIRPDYPGRPQQFGGMQSGHHPSMMYQSSQRIRGMGFAGGTSMHHSQMMGDGMEPMIQQNYIQQQQQQQQIMMQRRIQMKQAGMMAPPGSNGPGAPPNASAQQRMQSAGNGMGYMGSPGMMMDMVGSGNPQQSQVQQSPSQLQSQQMGNPGSSQMQLASSVPSTILPSASSTIQGMSQQQQQSAPRMLSHALSGKRPPSPGRRLPNYNDTMMMQQQQMVAGRGVMKSVDSYPNPIDPNSQRIRFSSPEYMDPPMYPPPQTPTQPNPNDTLSRFVNNMQ